MKHAYLILAHHAFGLLQLLVETLDDPRNDIYIHVDRKVKEMPSLKTSQAGLVMLENRVDVRWGDYSMVRAEEALFREAAGRGPYEYYHLLSGVDLPLKSQSYIHRFFEEHKGYEFIGYTQEVPTPDVTERMCRWYLFPGKFRGYNVPEYYLREGFLRLQRIAGIKRNRKTDFKKGPQWVSVTEGMAQWFLSHSGWIRKTFRHTYIPDESVFQTLCWNSPFRDRIFCLSDDRAGSLRLVGWRPDGTLADWSARDFEVLKESPALFARKFNLKDRDFLNRVKSLSGTWN